MNAADLRAILSNLESRPKIDFYDAGIAADRLAEEVEYTKKALRAVIEVLIQVVP